MPKALRCMAAGGQRAANQGDSGGGRMWEVGYKDGLVILSNVPPHSAPACLHRR